MLIYRALPWARAGVGEGWSQPLLTPYHCPGKQSPLPSPHTADGSSSMLENEHHFFCQRKRMAAKPMGMWEAELQLCISRLSPAKHPTCSHKPPPSVAPEDGEHRAGDPRQGLCRSHSPLLHLLTPKECRH